jgi:hypothetical protein
VIIVDAGGGTIDISDFACNADIPTFNEIAPPQCEFFGLFSSTFVNLFKVTSTVLFLSALMHGIS